MNSLNLLIQSYGDLCYLIVFLWTALEGETFVIFASLAAQKGLFNVWLLFLAAWSGSFFGDQVMFFLGRRYGIRIVKRFPKLVPPIDRCLSWLETHARGFILSYRFMYGIRNVSSFAIGMSHISWRTFLIWNAAAACLWAASFTAFGYFYGEMIEHFHVGSEEVDADIRYFTLSVLGLFVLILGFKALMARIHRKKMN